MLYWSIRHKKTLGSLSMRNYDCDVSPGKILDKLSALLCEERIAKEVDEPIDLAAHTFRLKITIPINYSKFNQVIAAFVRHLYRNGAALSHGLSEQEALAEAIFLLEGHYQNEEAKGYDKALLDAVGTDIEGFELVLYRLADAIKTVERKKYIQWVFVDNFFHLGWELKQRIVSFYLKQNEVYLQTPLIDLNPVRLVDHFCELLLNHLSDDNLINQVLANSIHFK